MNEYTNVSNLCCDRCGRSVSGKGYINNFGMIICGVCDYEIKNSNQKNLEE